MKHVISLGGSVLISNGFDIGFLKGFTALIKRSKDEFHIIIGGGKIARDYQKIGKKMGLNNRRLDEIGISATKLNAELMKHILGAKKVIENPEKPGKSRTNVYCGWKPGFSTDYVSIVVAKKLGVKRMINITKVGFVYNKEPSKKNAKKLKRISKKQMLKMCNKWEPGLKFPFDPKALRESKGIEIIVVGRNIENLKRAMKSKKFSGTTIHD